MKKQIKSILLLSAGLLAVNAEANVNNQLNVNANVKSGCFIQANDVNLGDLTGLMRGLYAHTTIEALCSKGVVYTIKTPIANSINYPTVGTLSYIYPMYHTTEPDDEFIPYRFEINDATYRKGSNLFGDGRTNNVGAASGYFQVTATGETQILPLDLLYSVFTHLKPGAYASSHVFTLEY